MLGGTEDHLLLRVLANAGAGRAEVTLSGNMVVWDGEVLWCARREDSAGQGVRGPRA